MSNFNYPSSEKLNHSAELLGISPEHEPVGMGAGFWLIAQITEQLTKRVTELEKQVATLSQPK